jgi:hypothetical protein
MQPDLQSILRQILLMGHGVVCYASTRTSFAEQ